MRTESAADWLRRCDAAVVVYARGCRACAKSSVSKLRAAGIACARSGPDRRGRLATASRRASESVGGDGPDARDCPHALVRRSSTRLVSVCRSRWAIERTRRRARRVQQALSVVPGAVRRMPRTPQPGRSAPDARRGDRRRLWRLVAPVLARPAGPTRAPDRAPAEAGPPPRHSQPASAWAQARSPHGRSTPSCPFAERQTERSSARTSTNA
jgi:hypothetical protein